MLTIILIIVLFICFIHLALNYNSTARLMRKIPGPKETFIFGHALKIMVSPGMFIFLLFKILFDESLIIFFLSVFYLYIFNITNINNDMILIHY